MRTECAHGPFSMEKGKGMFPQVTIFGRTFGTYALLAVAGLLAAGFAACRNARRRGYDDNEMIAVLLAAAVGAFLGGHLLYGITNWPLAFTLFSQPASGFGEAVQRIAVVFGGAVFYGGLLGGILAGCLCIRKKKLDLAEYAGLAAPAVPLFHFFGRIGCFLGGCCYGVECSFGFTYQNSLVPEANGVSRFPVQLAEAAFNLALVFLLSALLQRGWTRRLFPLYLALYAAGRFLLEFLRGDAIRGFAGPLSTSQWISLGILAVCGVLLLRSRRRPRATAASRPA